MIERRLWQQFLVLAEEEHVGRAAARLHMTQPPLSAAIASLESRLGVLLFDRERRRLRLNDVGRALVPEVRAWLAEAQALEAHARRLAQGLVQTLRVGFVSAAGFGDLPVWVRDFRMAHPACDLQLKEATLDVQLAALEQGGLDVGFVVHAEGDVPWAGECHLLDVQPMVCAQPQGWGPLDEPRLLSSPVVTFPRHIAPSLYDAVSRATAQFQGGISQEAIQMQTIINLVAAGMGVAWVPAEMRHLRRDGVVYREGLRSAPRCASSLLCAPGTSEVAQRFVTQVRAAVSARRG